MRGKTEKKGREGKKKRRKKMGTKSKKIKKKKSLRIFFLCAVVIFWINQKYAIWSNKQTISTFVFMPDIIGDFQRSNIKVFYSMKS